MINKGSKVTVWVSRGPLPESQVMENLVGMKAENARDYLMNLQGVDLERIALIDEANATVPAGQVIRTEPSAGATLPETGLIRLYISSGPSVKTATLPDFTTAFYTIDSATSWLEGMGFTNVTVLYEENEAPKDRIFYQSIEPGKEVDVTRALLLRVSKGKNSEVTPPDNEKPDPDDYVYKRITIELPTNKTESFVIAIYRSQVVDEEITQVLLEEREIPVGSISTEFLVSGKGVMSFIITLDGEIYGTMEVDFDATDDEGGNTGGEEEPDPTEPTEPNGE